MYIYIYIYIYIYVCICIYIYINRVHCIQGALGAAGLVGLIVAGPWLRAMVVGLSLPGISAMAASEAGPFTVHFWAPMSKWLISGDHIFLFVYIYIYVYIRVCSCVYIYTYIESVCVCIYL